MWAVSSSRSPRPARTCINVMEIRKVDRSVNEMLDGPGIQLSELAAKIQQLHIFFSLLIPI